MSRYAEPANNLAEALADYVAKDAWFRTIPVNVKLSIAAELRRLAEVERRYAALLTTTPTNTKEAP